MKTIRRIIAGLCLALPIAAAPGAAFAQRRGAAKDDKAAQVQEELGVAVGETKTIPASGVKQYSEGTPGVVDVRLTPDGSKFILVGQKQGSTSLLLIKNDGSQVNWVINVFSRSPELVEHELNQLLEGYPGLKVRRVGSRLFIEGGVSNEAEQGRIKQIAALYSGQVESLVTVGTGSTDRKLNIRVDFFFVQYNKNSGYQFGVSYPTTIAGPALGSEITLDFANPSLAGSKLTITNHPMPGLDIAGSYGWAKVMKQATVVTTNGNEATFENGGELNFPVTSGFAAQIQRISFGTNVTVQPRFDPTSRALEVKVEADVADLTPPQATNLPGRQTARLSTLVFLKLGQSLVLSGIHTQNQRHQIRGLPFLSRIPVLGVLFGSHSDQYEENEGAIFIIPSVVESVPRATYDIVKEAMAQYEDYSGSIEDVKSFQHTPPVTEEQQK